MKRILVFCLVPALLYSFTGKDKIVGKKMPFVSGTTMRGTKIDSTFFKGKITLIDFMYIGCPHCMEEAKALPGIIKTFEGTNFQVLCIAANTADHIKQFNSEKSSTYSSLRKYFGVDSIRYEIMPECLKYVPLKVINQKDTIITYECEVVAKRFKVDGYPNSFLVNDKGIIVKKYIGYSKDLDAVITNDIKEQVKQ